MKVKEGNQKKNPINTNVDNIPMVVDLDGTLINTDLLYEGVIVLLKKNFLYAIFLLPWYLRGKSYLKNKIFSIVNLKMDLLPYNTELLLFLHNEAKSGRKIILATASPLSLAHEISNIYPIFTKVFGTDKINLKGKNKLRALVDSFGERGFDYIGDSATDLIIFGSCRYAYLNNPSKVLIKRTQKISNLQFTWNSQNATLLPFVRAIRPHQWVKNLLLFVPLITAHLFTSANLVVQTFLAFIAFNLVASSGYLINDLLDLNSDRSHPRKKNRPLASGELSILAGILSTFALLLIGILIALKISYLFLLILLSYYTISIVYSLFLKRIALYDVFTLALLYSVRVIAGGTVINVQLSFWLIAFSTFIFLSLAFVKRYSELMQIDENGTLKHRGREYFSQDLNLLQIMGTVSGFSAIIVFLLYINTPEVSTLYSKPQLLWAVGLLLLFWICRIWLLTIRGKMTDDPITFTIKDFSSYFIFILIALTFLIAI